MRGFLAELWEPVAATGACEFVEDVLQALPVADDRDGDGRAAGGRAAAARVVQLDPEAVRRPERSMRRARADRARGRVSSTSGPARCSRPARPQPGDDLISHADRGRGDGRPALRRRVRQPRAQRPRRRRRHHPEPARARDAAVRRPPRAVGAAGASEPELAPRGGRGGRALRADHAVHRADHARGRRVPRRHVPGGHDRDGRAPSPPTATASTADAEAFDITADRDREQAAHVRRRASTTASGPTWPGPSWRRR